jgi:hypothetical protein
VEWDFITDVFNVVGFADMLIEAEYVEADDYAGW